MVTARTSKSGLRRKYSRAIDPSGLPSSSTMMGMGPSAPGVGSGTELNGCLAARTIGDFQVRPCALDAFRFQPQLCPKWSHGPDKDQQAGKDCNYDESDSHYASHRIPRNSRAETELAGEHLPHRGLSPGIGIPPAAQRKILRITCAGDKCAQRLDGQLAIRLRRF